MTTIQITNGPFKGTTFGPEQTYISAGISPNDNPRTAILKSAATQAFLTTFDPMQGWAVVIESKLLPVDMFPLPREGAVPQSAVPCAQFDARLSNPEGRVVATASTVWTINGPMDWERGETNARSRLFEALGLPTRFDITDGQEESPRKPSRASISIVPYQEPEAETEASVSTEGQEEAGSDAPDESPVGADVPGSAPVADAPSISEAAPLELVNSPVQEAKPKTTRKKRERLPDDAAPPQALLDQIQRLCKLRGQEAPVVTTKAEANDFLRSLMGG